MSSSECHTSKERWKIRRNGGGKPRRAVSWAAWAQSPTGRAKRGLGGRGWHGACGGVMVPTGSSPCLPQPESCRGARGFAGIMQLVGPSLSEARPAATCIVFNYMPHDYVPHLLTLIVYEGLLNQTSLEEKTTKITRLLVKALPDHSAR